MIERTFIRTANVKDKGPFNHETGNDRMCVACIVINACGVDTNGGERNESVLSLYDKTNSCPKSGGPRGALGLKAPGPP
jgi:hypothetical protein